MGSDSGLQHMLRNIVACIVVSCKVVNHYTLTCMYTAISICVLQKFTFVYIQVLTEFELMCGKGSIEKIQ